MKTKIRVSCVDQTLRLIERPLLASGGVNEVVVAFEFCELWDGFAKTGVFYRDEEAVYYAVLDEDDTCVIPWEVYSEPGYFNFAVFGVKDDIRRTANAVKYRAQKSVPVTEMIPSSPSVPGGGNENYISLADQTTGTKYKVYVNNGKLTMEVL